MIFVAPSFMAPSSCRYAKKGIGMKRLPYLHALTVTAGRRPVDGMLRSPTFLVGAERPGLSSCLGGRSIYGSVLH